MKYQYHLYGHLIEFWPVVSIHTLWLSNVNYLFIDGGLVDKSGGFCFSASAIANIDHGSGIKTKIELMTWSSGGGIEFKLLAGGLTIDAGRLRVIFALDLPSDLKKALNSANNATLTTKIPSLPMPNTQYHNIQSRCAKHVFISYAREDRPVAEKLYEDLMRQGIRTWIDSHSLTPGARWKEEIAGAIQESIYFISLLSSKSVSKIGYVQKEVRIALELLDEHPDDIVFVIPVRLEECSPSHKRLADLNWVDFFPDYNIGLRKILEVIGGTRMVYKERDNIDR